MVEIEVCKATPSTEEETQTTTLDINEMINRVRDFVNSIKNMYGNGQPMDITVEAFNFSIGKTGTEYELSVKLNLTFKPHGKAT
ncbi:MAG: hypothetical protein NWE95_05860 [Candidatus Bathyarchaeota archaeon]|nr:hypothetical protein [Candidatus Bathyarchaeota archaeon]